MRIQIFLGLILAASAAGLSSKSRKENPHAMPKTEGTVESDVEASQDALKPTKQKPTTDADQVPKKPMKLKPLAFGDMFGSMFGKKPVKPSMPVKGAKPEKGTSPVKGEKPVKGAPVKKPAPVKHPKPGKGLLPNMFGNLYNKEEVEEECAADEAEDVCTEKAKTFGSMFAIMFDPNKKPIHKPMPGTKPDTKPGAKPDTKPETKPGAKPGTSAVKPNKFADMFKDMVEKRPIKIKPGVKPGTKPGEKPTTKPGEKPSVKPGSKPSVKPGTKPSVVKPTTELTGLAADVCVDGPMRHMIKKVGKTLEGMIWDKKFRMFTFSDALEIGFGILHKVQDSWCGDFMKLSTELVNPNEDSKSQFKRFAKFLIKTFDKMGMDLPARHFKDFITQFEKIYNLAMREMGEDTVKPNQKPLPKPAKKPAEKPAEKPVKKPAEKPEEKPAEKPASDEEAKKEPVKKERRSADEKADAKTETKAEEKPEANADAKAEETAAAKTEAKADADTEVTDVEVIEEPMDVCKGSLQTAKDFHKKFAKIIKRGKEIYRKHFDSKQNKKYDSVGVMVGAGYSIAKHIFVNQKACISLLDAIQEIQDEMGDEMIEKFKDSKYLQTFEENPMGKIMDLMDGKLGKLAGKVRFFLQSDKTKPLDRNAKFGWMVLTQRISLTMKMLPQLFEYLDQEQRDNPEVRDEIGFVFSALEDNKIDLPEMAKRQEEFARLVGESSICGQNARAGGESCDEMTQLQEIITNLDSSEIIIKSSLVILAGLLLL